MSIIERKVSFGDPLCVHFKDAVIVPKILKINSLQDVWVDSSTFGVDDPHSVGLPRSYYDEVTADEVTAWHEDWEEIGLAPKKDWQRIREIIFYYLNNFELDDEFGEKPSVGLEDGQFAVGPAVKIKKGEAIFLRNSVGIWYKEPEIG